MRESRPPKKASIVDDHQKSTDDGHYANDNNAMKKQKKTAVGESTKIGGSRQRTSAATYFLFAIKQAYIQITGHYSRNNSLWHNKAHQQPHDDSNEPYHAKQKKKTLNKCDKHSKVFPKKEF